MRKKNTKLKKSWLPSCSGGRRPCDLGGIAVALSTVCDHTAALFDQFGAALSSTPIPAALLRHQAGLLFPSLLYFLESWNTKNKYSQRPHNLQTYLKGK